MKDERRSLDLNLEAKKCSIEGIAEKMVSVSVLKRKSFHKSIRKSVRQFIPNS